MALSDYRSSGTTTGLSRFRTSVGKPDLSTSRGLMSVAKTAGLGAKAEKKTQVGEDPNKIFSGGFIQDVFDVLNAPQSAVVGIVKGENVLNAISRRASFSDSDLLGKYGTQGKVAGIIADIATDPLMLIPVLGIGERVLGGIKGGAKLVASTKMGKPAADFLAKRLLNRYGQDPSYARLAEDAITKVNKGGQKAVEITKPITELSAGEQRTIAEARKAGKLHELPQDLLDRAKPAFDELNQLGQRAVDEGLLPAEVYQKNIKSYIARLYRTKEVPPIGKVTRLFPAKPIREELSRFMARKDIPEDVRKSMGEITEAGYPLAKSLVQLNQAVERSRFFGTVSQRWGKDVAEEGLKKLPDAVGLGKLSGKFVPSAIWDDIQQITRVKSWGEELGGKVIRGFKYGKVVLNPATHIRNILSNMVLNDFAGLSPLRLDIYAKAAKEIATNGKLYQEARKAGLGLDTFWGGEIRSLLINSGDSALKRLSKRVVNKMGDLYQNEEKFAKMAQYVFQRGKGLTPEESFKVAESATFNYAQVTPFIRRLRESIFGVPFITFTYKATPRVVESLITKPSVIGKYGFVKRGVESMTPRQQLAQERAVEPDYIRQGFYVRLPLEDKYGRALYFDATYLLPFGSLMSGTVFAAQKPGENIGERVMGEFPILNALGELYQNEDFFGEPIVKPTSTESLEIGTDIFNYIAKAYGPPPFTDTPQRLVQAAQISKLSGAERGTKRTITEEIIRNFGLKVRPFVTSQEKQRREREKKEALTKLLEGAGKVRTFERTFIPK